MNRTRELLLKAADALDEGKDPLEHWFLAENDVTLNECYDLAGNLALGARILATSPDPARLALVAILGSGRPGMASEEVATST